VWRTSGRRRRLGRKLARSFKQLRGVAPNHPEFPLLAAEADGAPLTIRGNGILISKSAIKDTCPL
jgi:hypothetical protein